MSSIACDKRAPILITDANGRNAGLAAATLTELQYNRVRVLEGGLSAWKAAGLPIEQGLSGVIVPPQDVVPTGGDRPCHEMINYLRWEEALGRASTSNRRPSDPPALRPSSVPPPSPHRPWTGAGTD